MHLYTKTIRDRLNTMFCEETLDIPPLLRKSPNVEDSIELKSAKHPSPFDMDLPLLTYLTSSRDILNFKSLLNLSDLMFKSSDITILLGDNMLETLSNNLFIHFARRNDWEDFPNLDQLERMGVPDSIIKSLKSTITDSRSEKDLVIALLYALSKNELGQIIPPFCRKTVPPGERNFWRL